jgi:transcriptional regulator with XRE-family HTH domain
VSSPERLSLLRRVRGLRLGEAAGRVRIPVWDLWSAERGDTVPLDARERLEAILRDGRYPLSGESPAVPSACADKTLGTGVRALPEERCTIPRRALPEGWKPVPSYKRLARLRRAAGLKMSEAAQLAGVSLRDLWEAERGGKVPPGVRARLEAVLRRGYPSRAKKTALTRRGVGGGESAPVSSPEELARRRLEAGLTRAEAAKQAGVSPTTLFKAESGGRLLPEFRARLERIIREGYRSLHGRSVDLFEELSAPVSSPEKLLRLRREAGLTLAEAAEQAGVSASSVRKAEHGGRLRPEIRAKFERILREGYRRKGEQIDLFGVAEA